MVVSIHPMFNAWRRSAIAIHFLCILMQNPHDSGQYLYIVFVTHNYKLLETNHDTSAI